MDHCECNWFINYEMEYDINKPYIPIEEEIIGMLDGGGDVVIDRVGCKDVESALTLKQFVEQRPTYVITPFI